MASRGPLWWLLGLGGITAFAALRAWNPEHPGFQVCVFRNLLDFPCPGCGLTRAMSHLAHGSVARAFELHPLGPLLGLEAAAGWVAWGVLGRARLEGWVLAHAGTLVTLHVVPYLALWLGRAATGTLPY